MSERIRAPYKNYEVNQRKILKALDDLDAAGNPFPTYKEIAKECGLNHNTIVNHYKKLDFGYICSRERIHSPRVIASIRKSANAGMSRAQKLYAQIMESYIEKRDRREIVEGELNLNSNVSGELSVNINRRVIMNREDLDKVKAAANIVQAKAKKNVVSGDSVVNGKFEHILGEIPTVVKNVDTMIFFK